MSDTVQNVDRLSSLPDEVLSHILSLMPTRMAVQTSILSKRWRYNWTLVTNLDFDDKHPLHGLDSLSSFVDRVLELCQTSHLQLFRLHFSEIWVRKSSISKWINNAVRLSVRELDIQVILLELPLNLFTCKTVTKLRLDRSSHDSNWNCPSPVNLPCLKTLDIVVLSNPYANAFKLINGCPILENLSLKVTWRNDEEEYSFNIPTLKRLELTFLKCVSVINKVVLHLPNLEYLFVGGTLCSLFVMEDLSGLSEAAISFFEVRYKHLLVELLKGISGAKLLSQSSSTIAVSLNYPLPKFPNLENLELKSCFRFGWILIAQILERSSELEHVCIEEEESCWIEPQSVPPCNLTNLKTMKLAKCNEREYNIQFQEFMFRNVVLSKTLNIKCSCMHNC